MILTFLRQITANLTQEKRYVPDTEWSSKCWTFNLFRAYEYVFGRRYGIKLEVSAGTYFDEKTNQWKEYQVAHTFEASLAILEAQIRNLFTFKFKLPYRVYVPALQTANGIRLSDSPYLFAIAYDAKGESTTGFGTGDITWSHTCTGSDRAIFITSAEPETGGYSGFTTKSYAGVASTQLGYKSVSNATSDWYVVLFGLLAPSTGANNCIIKNPENNLGGASVSYSGVLQSGLPDSVAEVNSGGSNVTSINLTTTVVASDCWLVGTARGMGGIVAAGSGTTARAYTYMPTNKYVTMLDSNGTVGTGSQTLVATAASGKMGGVVVSIAPSITNTIVSPAAQALTFSLPQETITAGAVLGVNAQSATFSIPAYAVSGKALVSVNAQTATFSLPVYTLIANGIALSPNVQSLTFSIPTYQILSGATLNVGAQSLTFSVAAPAITGAALVNPQPVTATFSIPTLAFVGALWQRSARATTGADWTRTAINND